MKSGLFGLALAGFVTAAHANPNPPVDCNCVTNLPALQTNGCQGIVPDLCLLATNCFSPAVIIGSPGYCSQSPPPDTIVGPGTTSLLFTVMDSQSNTVQCVVPFTVNPPPSSFSLICVSNKTVQCGSGWTFDVPTWVTTCCDTNNVLVWESGTVTNGTCPQIITRSWHADDACLNYSDCSQTVTVVDTTPPSVICNTNNLVPNGDFESFV
jgi:hypothetical protein